MILKQKEVYILNLAMNILTIKERFCRFGIMTTEEYQNSTYRLSSPEQPLVYNEETLDGDGLYTVFSGIGNSARYYKDMIVRYFKTNDKEDDFISVAIPVVYSSDCKNCKQCNIDTCKEIAYYQFYLIARDGTIAEDIDSKPKEGPKVLNCKTHNARYNGILSRE